VTSSGQRSGIVSTWIRAGALTALVDGLFSSVLSAVFYGSTVTRLFQGVAPTLLGPKALEGGTPTAKRSGARYRATGRDLWVFERHGDSCLAVWRTMLDMQENAA
jgi:hypothetical protein